MKRYLWPLLTLMCLCAFAARAHAASDWSYPSHTGTTPLPINDNWNGEDVTVDADADDALYEVYNVGQGFANDLTITSTGKGDAILTFGQNVVSVNDVAGNNPSYRVNFMGDATLTGYYEPDPDPSKPPLVVGEAVLEVKNGKDSSSAQAGNIVYVHGLTTLSDYSRILVDGTTAAFLTGQLSIAGEGASVKLDNQGLLRVYGTTSITNGTLDIFHGIADFYGDVSVSGEKAVLQMDFGGIRLGERDKKADQTINMVLEDGGTFRVVAAGYAVIMNETNSNGYKIEGTLQNTSGYLVVEAGGYLDTKDITKTVVGSSYSNAAAGVTHGTEIFGDLAAGDFEMVGGTMRVANGGTATAEVFKVSDGALDVESGGRLYGSDIQVAGGTVEIAGTLGRETGVESTFAVQGGAVRVLSGGLLDTDKVEVTGSGATFVVASGGQIAAGTDFYASAGTVSFSSGSNIAGGLAGSGLKKLNISSAALLNLTTEVLTDEFEVTGTINFNTDGALEVKQNTTAGFVQNLNGRLNLMGGSALFHNDVNVGGVTGRGIYGTEYGGSIDLDNNSLSTSGNGRIDASDGNVSIVNVADFAMNGVYVAGYVDKNVTKLEVTGMQANGGDLTVGANAKFYMTADLQMHANLNKYFVNGLRILDTDADLLPSDLGPFFTVDESTGVTYTYELRDEGDGYGLYVTGAQAKSRDLQYRDIVASWRTDPNVGDNVHNVLRDDFINAIIDGNAIRVGLEGDYTALTDSGKFNARVLSSLMNRKNSGYDALMLYNGSGVGMAHQAVLNSNQQTMKRLSLRNQFIRREILLAGETCNPCYDEFEELEVARVNRVWASGNYSTDSAGSGDGFAGYKYRGKGLLVGYDRLFDRFAAGAAVSYMGGDFRDGSALSNGSTIDTYGVHLYGNFQSDDDVFVSASLGYTYSDNQLCDARTLDGKYGWNKGDFGGNSLMAAINVGKDFHLGDYFILSPSVGFNYVNTRNSSHRQYFAADGQPGGGGATLDVSGVSGHSTTLPIDLALSYELYGTDESMFVLTGNVGYAYEFNNKGASGTVTYADLPGVGPVQIATREIGRHVLNLGVNAKYNYKQYEVGLGYDYIGRNRYNSHSVLLSGAVVF